MVSAGLLQGAALAGEVSKNQALTIATHVVSQYFPAEWRASAGNIHLNPATGPDEPFYVCNVGETGFVLVSKSENCPPVLGFSWEGGFPAGSSASSPLLNNVLDNIRRKCADFNSRDSVNLKITESWKQLSMPNSAATLKSGITSPLLATTWNCDSTFFNLFPKDFRGGGSVPIAMGQVFRYYGTPATGTGELCYELLGYGELCTKFDQAHLRFNAMSNTLGNAAVDSLIYYMSVCCMLQPTGGSTLDAYKQTLPLYFGYSNSMRAVESWNYNIADVIRHQLSLRRPVPADWLGHSFVIDGYFPDNLFHFNMGLGGLYNGFYLLDYPVFKVDTEHSLLNCYVDYHPISTLPAVANLTAVPEGDSIRISWTSNLSDSLRSKLVRFVVLRDGLIPLAETLQSTVVLSPAAIGASCNLMVVSDFGPEGASELSVPYLYLSNLAVADIPSLALRQLINTQLGASDLLRQPLVGELELIRELQIDFPDQRGIEKLPELKNLRIDGTNIKKLREGDYLQRLQHLRFFNCQEFDYSIFGKTCNLYQAYGYDFLPVDLYDFRHNTNLGLGNFVTIGINPNALMDVYGVDKYFPKLADFYIAHLPEGIGGSYEDCFVSYESFLDFYPKIKGNRNLLLYTKPTSFAPCYPVPARNVNLPAVSRLSWQSNFKDQPGVYYNVFVGNSRTTMELVSVFQTDKFYDGQFDPDMEYYWRVESYHADSTYYSGIFHFSTWQDLPIPFVDRFDSYYAACPVVEESPFWVNFDTKLTGKAVTNRNTKYEGFYSLELKPKSDAGVVIKTPKDPEYYIEFRFMNQGGEVTVELLQKSGSSDENIVNSKIEFTGKEAGLFTYAGSTFPFTLLPDRWNRINIALNMTTGVATLSLNEVAIKEWQWHVQIGGMANSNPFKGIRFVNNAATNGGSGFVDNMVIDAANPLSARPVMNPEIGMVYLKDSREVVFSGIETSGIREIALYDIQGRKLISTTHPSSLTFPIGRQVKNGIYLIVVDAEKSMPFSRKLAILD
jgi:hypothetical protein